jgi:hypothetical protein
MYSSSSKIVANHKHLLPKFPEFHIIIFLEAGNSNSKEAVRKARGDSKRCSGTMNCQTEKQAVNPDFSSSPFLRASVSLCLCG